MNAPHTQPFSMIDPKRFSFLWKEAQIPDQRPLYFQGNLEALELLPRLTERGLAVVGSRHPDARSVAFLSRAIERVQNLDLILISGLARGIDATVHECAIRHQIPTIAVLGTSLDNPHPWETNTLRRKILDSGGLLISEIPPGTKVQKFHYLERNRLIAAWSKALWVVCAARNSGTLSSANHARAFGRTCLVTPGYPDDPALAGNRWLLESRDPQVVPFWGPHSLDEVWPEASALEPSARSGAAAIRSTLSIEQLQLLRSIDSLPEQQPGARLAIHPTVHTLLSQGWSAEALYPLLHQLCALGHLYIDGQTHSMQRVQL